MIKIVLTGGGTAGHVTPNIALIEKLKEENFHIEYIGSKDGIEKELIKRINIPYHEISSGKLRRYFSFKNFTDIFRIIKGVIDSIVLISKIKPEVVFSKGGFVSVPVIIGAKLNKVPSILHESDISLGLANKLSLPFVKYICYSFPETEKTLPSEKSFLTGTPIRSEIFKGDMNKGFEKTNFERNKPVILFMGGSLGSVFVNNCLRDSLDELLEKYNIIHICGKNNLDKSINKKGYFQIEYAINELADFFKMTDIIVSRAGANSISEFLALKKPNLLIPLSLRASRGDQILNAKSFEKQGFSLVLEEEEISKSKLIDKINELFENKEQFIKNMEKSSLINSVDKVYEIIEKIIE